MAISADTISQGIINQLKLLDPTVSAEVGTPERKIIDATAEMIASQQVDFTVLQQQTDISTLSGGRLDAYLSIFNFGRQQAVASYGTVTFKRNTNTTTQLVIPRGTQVQANLDDSVFPSLVFVTTDTAVMGVGTSSVDVTVQCTVAGSVGNIDAGKIVGFAGLQSVAGVSSVTNAQAFTGGQDAETDAAYTARFQNSFMRNISGTTDMFLALAVSMTGVTKANVVGAISRYQEYVQVPASNDAAQNTVNITNNNYDPSGSLWPHKRTTAKSTIPYSQYTYPVNYYLTNGTLDPATAKFYRQGVDYVFNAPPIDATVAPNQATTTPTTSPNVTFLIGDIGAPTGLILTPTATGGSLAAATYYYKVTALNANGESLPSGEQNTGALSGSTNEVGVSWTAVPGATSYRIYRGTAAGAENTYYTSTTTSFLDTGTAGTAGSPPGTSTALVYPSDIISGAILLLEHAYVSTHSRNNPGLGILNCVDVFINGANNQQASSSETLPPIAHKLQNSTTTVWTYQLPGTTNNFTRKLDSQPAAVGSLIEPLYWQPVTSLPDSITIGADTYLQANYWHPADSTYYWDSTFQHKAHYIFVEETNTNYGTVRARNGIEWFQSGNNYLNGQLATDTTVYNGSKIETHIGTTYILDYFFDQNVADGQAIMEKNKQTTQDVLVHKSRLRYFQPIVTIMYAFGVTQSVVNASIYANLAAFFENQYYGAAIQLSDVLQTIHNTPGVDNVRYTNSGGVAINEVSQDGQTVLSTHATDFYIQDSELADSPSANQAVITVRAQNTWGT